MPCFSLLAIEILTTGRAFLYAIDGEFEFSTQRFVFTLSLC